MIAMSGRSSGPRDSTTRMSDCRRKIRRSSVRISSISAASASFALTTSTRPPTIWRCWSADASATEGVALLPMTWSSSPSRAARTSSACPRRATWARAITSIRSIVSSLCAGSWWKSTRRSTPAASATSTAYSMLLWPQPTLSRYSSSVYCASWMTRFAPFRKAMWRSSPGCWETRPEAFQKGSWSVA